MTSGRLFIHLSLTDRPIQMQITILDPIEICTHAEIYVELERAILYTMRTLNEFIFHENNKQHI